MKTMAQVEPRTPIEGGIITNEIVLGVAGSYYLTGNINATGTAIRIVKENITLDLNGFSLTGGATDIGVHVDGRPGAALGNVTVKNGRVTGSSDQAVQFDPVSGQCSGNVIRECTVSEPFFSCIYIVPASGGQCDGNTIDRCTFSRTDNGSAVSVFTLGGSFNGNVIRGCAMTDLSSGVSLSGSTGELRNCTVADCVIETMGGSGINIFPPAHGNLIKNNVIRSPTDQGIWVASSTGNRVENNHITGTGESPDSTTACDPPMRASVCSKG